ncbi:hypothetical protein O2W15_01280 [Modestobacter sp. VKM Ac-2979]|uniref:hypothetical protein n=1 Tax=unclassified Modestobacter TaxID=2643866 RepID=UPI0022AB6D31|nr:MULTISPECIES: hypothetical protein [unclassified Modestobacter]MCZ2810056.1 hypothetical protein [Modestobacter sp. VKM Ac-2979]MCZ2844687.1 hypothetical protein [Modestobacter sp. VKM Ac-2980]
MTHSIDTPRQSGTSGASEASGAPKKSDVAKDQARDVGKTAQQAGSDVAGTAADQAKQVAQETKQQAQDLVQQGVSQLQGQVRGGTQKAGQGLSDIAQQLRIMVDGSDQTPSGPAADLVRQAGDKVEELAGWLQDREPGDLVAEVRSFARRKPGAFMLGAALAGVLAGRLTTGVVASHKSESSSGNSGQQQRIGSGSPDTHATEAAGTNYVAGTPAAGYATTGTTGTVPPPPYGTVPPEGAAVPPTTAAGWDDPARTPGEGRR